MAGYNPTRLSGAEVQDNSLWNCEQCGCLVQGHQKDIHLEWHEKLRRSVDETEGLG